MRLSFFFAIFFVANLLFQTNLLASGEYETLIREAELKGDRAKVTTLCREWYQSGQYSPGVLNWCYNALMSVEPGAVLITQNDYDTYPVWMLQYALGVRPDVSVLSLPLLENKEYREKIIHLNPMKYVPTGQSLSEFLSNLLTDRGDLRNNPVYFSAVIEKERLETNKQHLYITGLALKFSRTTFDNLTVLRGNVENDFRMDYLDLEFQKEPVPETVRSLNISYLPAFFLLYKYYVATGESAKAGKLQRLSLKIGRDAGQEAQVRTFFFPLPAPVPALTTGIKTKDLEKRIKKINDNFWAGETEVTNGEYEQFLSDLLKNKEFGLLDSCKSAKTDWRALLPENFRSLTDAKIFEHGHPDAPAHPVQNISYEAAKRYCEWITQVYNADTGKKKFKKVLFRLPTKAEWENFAAFGLPAESPYPWGGYYVRNSKGCYLGNYFATEPCKDCPDQASDSNDGGFFTVPAASYFPNKAGLYCISGNVAEMVAEPGITKGGSWQDEPYYGQVKPEKIYNAPGPAIGFRVVMEVIE